MNTKTRPPTIDDFKEIIRKEDLQERLFKVKSMIGDMCHEMRPPKMSIPVRCSDEDIFITTTIEDAITLTEVITHAGRVAKDMMDNEADSRSANTPADADKTRR